MIAWTNRLEKDAPILSHSIAAFVAAIGLAAVGFGATRLILKSQFPIAHFGWKWAVMTITGGSLLTLLVASIWIRHLKPYQEQRVYVRLAEEK